MIELVLVRTATRWRHDRRLDVRGGTDRHNWDGDVPTVQGIITQTDEGSVIDLADYGGGTILLEGVSVGDIDSLNDIFQRTDTSRSRGAGTQ